MCGVTYPDPMQLSAGAISSRNWAVPWCTRMPTDVYVRSTAYASNSLASFLSFHRISSSILLYVRVMHLLLLFFFFNDTATTEIYTLSLHDALPISPLPKPGAVWRM